MAAPSTIPELLDTLAKSVVSALDVADKVSSIEPAENAVSLLDLKNELLLSYLQNMVFLVLLKLRKARGTPGMAVAGVQDVGDAVVKKLVELRLYLEKGVKPIEDKMRYQIEILIRAADEATSAQRKAAAASDEDSEEDGPGDSDGPTSGQDLKSGNAASGDDANSNNGSDPDSEPETVYTSKPRLSALIAVKPAGNEGSDTPDGVYRPPKRERQLMEPTAAEKRSKAPRRPQKSATMDEFLADELSTIPMPLPSIGTTIVSRGRHLKTDAERRVEEERREYEESNFVRLPRESKKEKSKRQAQEGGGGRMVFGGEEWRDLSDRVDRIDRLVKEKDRGKGSNVKALLDKSRKRGAGSMEGGAGARARVGERFEKRLKMMEGGIREKGGGKRR